MNYSLCTKLYVHLLCSTSRKKDKKSTKPRRITLTPLQQSVHHHTSHHQSPHFTPPLLTTLSSHPAFEVEAVTTSCSPSHLSEERRLLRRVRSKQTMKRRSAGGSEALQSNAAIDQHESSNSMPWVTVGRSFVNKQTSEMTRDNPPQFTTDPLRTTPSKVTSLTKLNNSDTTQSSLTSGYTALTSTPLSTGSCQYIVTLNRVNNRKSLDKLSHIYSKMITGIYILCHIGYSVTVSNHLLQIVWYLISHLRFISSSNF